VAEIAAEIVVYVKFDCDLCEALLEELGEALSTAEFELASAPDVRDIEENQAWYRKHRENVPVIAVNGEEVGRYFVDADAFSKALSTGRGEL